MSSAYYGLQSAPIWRKEHEYYNKMSIPKLAMVTLRVIVNLQTAINLKNSTSWVRCRIFNVLLLHVFYCTFLDTVALPVVFSVVIYIFEHFETPNPFSQSEFPLWPLFSAHAHVQRGGASVREYPYSAINSQNYRGSQSKKISFWQEFDLIVKIRQW